METYDWSRFVTRILINAPVQTLYNAWSNQKGIEYWFLRLSEYRSRDGKLRESGEEVQAGDTYLWRWHGWPDDVEERGEIIDCNGRDYFKFSFGEAGICTVDLKKENGQTLVELTQSEIPTDERSMHYWHLGCKTGWTFHLTNMKSIFEGGLDLRNKDEGVKNVINA